MLFHVKMMSPNNFLEGMEMKLANTILAALCLEIIETLPGYLVPIFGPIMIMSTMTRSCFRIVGDAGNTSLVDAGAPLGATAVVTAGSAGIYFGSAASWRPCNVVRPHQGLVSHSRRLYGRPSAQCNAVTLGTTRVMLWWEVIFVLFYVYLLSRWFEMVLTQCDFRAVSALNVKVVENKRG